MVSLLALYINYMCTRTDIKGGNLVLAFAVRIDFLIFTFISDRYVVLILYEHVTRLHMRQTITVGHITSMVIYVEYKFVTICIY